MELIREVVDPSTLSFEELPPPAFSSARSSILALGFAEEAVLRNFRFSTGLKTTAVANALAFADPTQRTPADYAAISVYNQVGGETADHAVEVLSSSGALFHLLHQNETFDFWSSGFDTATDRPIPRQVFQGASYDRLSEALQRFAVDLAPARIVDVKRGREQFRFPEFSEVQPLQLALWTIEVNRQVLNQHFGNAVEVIRAAQHRSQAWADHETTALAVYLLGLVVLADTGALGDETRLSRESLSLEELWDRGRERFHRYFVQIPPSALPAARQALDILSGVSYAGFQPEMLIGLYTAAYTKPQRRELGRFDTPMYLTRRIWEHIPVELLPPERRTVCDMTSGWGSFLIAAHERLSRLGDMRGRALRDYLHGNDISPSAALLARFGLLLSTLQDSWHVDAEDALTWKWLERERPGIIVGNPPFKGDRKTPTEGAKTRTQEADAFLERAIDCLAPDGMLAMIMPRSFAVAEASPLLRQKLLEKCSLFEVWELPVEVFEDAKVRPVVIFAQKHGTEGAGSRSPVIARTVQANTMPDFRDAGLFTRSALMPEPKPPAGQTRKASAKDHALRYTLILSEAEWARVRELCVPLNQRAHIFRGCIVGAERRRRKTVLAKPSRPVPFLQGGKAVMPSRHYIDYSLKEMVEYPRGFEEPRENFVNVLEGSKVLVGYVVEPKWGQQIKTAIERQGVFVSDHFWVIAPSPEGGRENVTNEVLAAVVEWAVGNAWVVEHIRSTYLPKSALETLPIPRQIEPSDRDALTAAVREIENAARAGARDPAGARATIDQILRRMYGLPDDLLQRLQAVAEWGDHSPPTLDHGANSAASWPVDGIVEAVNPTVGTVTLWLDGFHEVQAVPVSGHVPGWLLKEGTPFRTSITREAWESREIPDASVFGPFTVMPYAYLDETGLVDRLAEVTVELAK